MSERARVIVKEEGEELVVMVHLGTNNTDRMKDEVPHGECWELGKKQEF